MASLAICLILPCAVFLSLVALVVGLPFLWLAVTILAIQPERESEASS
jgi:hypothetical protein